MFLKKPIQWLVNLFGNIVKWVRPKAEDAIKIVNILKSFVESPAADALVKFTPSRVDDVLLAQMRAWLPKIAYRLQIVQEISTAENADEAINELIKYLRNLHKNVRPMFYTELAALITEAFADGKIDRSEAIAISQAVYQELRKS